MNDKDDYILDFVIIGPAHGATGWASQFLTEKGFPCGHEHTFNIEGIIENDNYIGDSSWLAAGYSLDELRHYVKHIFAVQRPLDNVVNSVLRRWRDWPTKYQEAYTKITGEKPLDPPATHRCVQTFWKKIYMLEPEAILYTYEPKPGLEAIANILAS